jgi:chemotaxis signal transduction protein
MTTMEATNVESYILLKVGEARFAVPATQVAELVAADRQHKFPHLTPWLGGVLVCRGRIVPVVEISRVLPGITGSDWRFYLLGRWKRGDSEEWIALPANGTCELFQAVPFPVNERRSGCVSGVLWIGEETVDVLDLQKMMDAAAEHNAEVENDFAEGREQ